MGATVFSSMPKGGMLSAVLRSMAWGGREVIASQLVGGAVYAAVRDGDKVVGVVGLIEGLSYKLLSEEEGPYYYDAPPEVLDALTPTASPWAMKWREACAARAAENVARWGCDELVTIRPASVLWR